MAAPPLHPPDVIPAPATNGTDFDAIAGEYDQSLPAHVVTHYLAKRLTYITRKTEPGLALEVGSGTGLLAEQLTAAGYDVVASDPSRGMLRQLRQRQPDFPTVVAGGEALPFPDDQFSLTYCVAVMHHVAAPSAVRQTLIEMARVTRPGGHVIIWDHNPRNPYWPLLMRRVPQDTGAERLIPEAEIHTGLSLGGANVIASDQLGLVPDFAPRRLLGVAAGVERLVESVPGLRRLCAHNVVLAIKAGNGVD
jgi:SAM-dependent methyltransferase